jgi:hypothetical protein
MYASSLSSVHWHNGREVSIFVIVASSRAIILVGMQHINQDLLCLPVRSSFLENRLKGACLRRPIVLARRGGAFEVSFQRSLLAWQSKDGTQRSAERSSGSCAGPLCVRADLPYPFDPTVGTCSLVSETFCSAGATARINHFQVAIRPCARLGLYVATAADPSETDRGAVEDDDIEFSDYRANMLGQRSFLRVCRGLACEMKADSPICG